MLLVPFITEEVKQLEDIPAGVEPLIDLQLIPNSCKTYECLDKTFLSVDYFLAGKIDGFLEDNKQSGLMSHRVLDERLIIVTWPSGIKKELCFYDF